MKNSRRNCYVGIKKFLKLSSEINNLRFSKKNKSNERRTIEKGKWLPWLFNDKPFFMAFYSGGVVDRRVHIQQLCQ